MLDTDKVLVNQWSWCSPESPSTFHTQLLPATHRSVLLAVPGPRRRGGFSAGFRAALCNAGTRPVVPPRCCLFLLTTAEQSVGVQKGMTRQ